MRELAGRGHDFAVYQPVAAVPQADGSVVWRVLGREVRTPVRKALLAGSVTPETYGRALGFERMMDTLGAVVLGEGDQCFRYTLRVKA